MVEQEKQVDDVDLKDIQKQQEKLMFWSLIVEILEFIFLSLIIAIIPLGILYLIFGLDYIFENTTIIWGIFFYPYLFSVFILWIKLFKKRDFKEFVLGGPHLPKKGHRWFYYFWLISWTLLLITYILLLVLKLVNINQPIFELTIDFFHGVIGAAIVEEIIFRGYIYSRSEDIYGKNRYFTEWNAEKIDKKGVIERKSIMTFEITYAALVSSILFGIYHFSPLQSIFTFLGGLFFCKFRNEWQSLIPGMIMHGMWNAMIIFYLATDFKSLMPF